MKLFKRIVKECKRDHVCEECLLFKDGDCLIQRPPCEWNKHEIKKALRKEK